MPRSLLACLLTVLAIGTAIGCDGDADGPDASPTPTALSETILIGEREPIVIGVSAALSGGQMAIGQDLADAVTLAVEDFGRPIAGHEVTVLAADDGCNDPEAAVAASRTLIDDGGAIAVIGPMCTTGAQAANDEYEDAGLVHITPSATRVDLSQQGSQYFFRTAWRDDDQALVQATYAREELRADTAVVIDDGEPYGRTLADTFVPVFEEQGGTITSRERIMRGERSFTSLARQIVGAGPDVVVFQGLDPEGALLLSELRAEGYEGSFVGPDSLFNADDFIGGAGEAAEGAILTSGPVPDTDFNDRFTARFGRPPSTSFVLQAYDGARVLLTALDSVAEEESGGASIDRARFVSALRDQAFAGFTGGIDFSAEGDRTGETARDLGLAIYRVNGGVFEQVE